MGPLDKKKKRTEKAKGDSLENVNLLLSSCPDEDKVYKATAYRWQADASVWRAVQHLETTMGREIRG